MKRKNTTQQVHKNKLNPPNKTGKGGFGDHPENRNPGGWKKEDTISYQYNMLLRLSVSEFKSWQKKFPEKNRTVAQELAYQAVREARTDLPYLKEVTDRTEGKAPLAPQDRPRGGVELDAPKTEEEKEIMLELMNAHYDYVSSKSNTDE